MKNAILLSTLLVAAPSFASQASVCAAHMRTIADAADQFRYTNVRVYQSLLNFENSFQRIAQIDGVDQEAFAKLNQRYNVRTEFGANTLLSDLMTDADYNRYLSECERL